MNRVIKVQLINNSVFNNEKDKKTYQSICNEIEDEIRFKKECLGIENFKVTLKTKDDLKDSIFEYIGVWIYSDELLKGWSVPLYLIQVQESD